MYDVPPLPDVWLGLLVYLAISSTKTVLLTNRLLISLGLKSSATDDSSSQMAPRGGGDHIAIHYTHRQGQGLQLTIQTSQEAEAAGLSERYTLAT